MKKNSYINQRQSRGNAAVIAGVVSIALTQCAVVSHAQTFPTRPLRIIVGFTPGTTTDITARLLGEQLADRVGQNVVVDNRPGANSGLANQMVETATPDGHTLLIGTLSLVTGPMLYKELPFNPANLAPVSLIVLAPNVICVFPALPARNVKELVELAKSRPGKLRYGSSGRGSSAFLTLELFKSMAGVNLQEIPYKATSQAVTDTIGGQIEIYPPNLVSAFPLLNSGRLRALAVTSLKRSTSLPDVPAVSETVPGYDATTGVYGILVPAKTPPAVIERLSREIAAVARLPAFRDKMVAGGAEVTGGTPREYAAFLEAERAKWGGLFKKLGISPQ